MVRGLEVWSEYEVCVNASTEEGGQGAGNCTLLRTLPAGDHHIQYLIVGVAVGVWGVCGGVGG